MKKWIASATTLVFCVLILVLFWPHPTSAQRQTLNLYIWSEYIDPDILTAFEKATNSRVVVSVYESNEDMIAKLRGGRRRPVRRRRAHRLRCAQHGGAGPAAAS